MNLDPFQGDPRDQFSETSELSPNDRQILGMRLKLRSELVSDFRDEFDGLYVVVEDPVRNKFFSLGSKEYRFLAKLDGKSTIAETVAKADDGSFDEKSAIAICNFAVNSNLLVGEDLDNSSRLEQQLQSKENLKAISRLNLISIKFKLFNPNSFLQQITTKTQWLFSTPFFFLWLLTGIWAASTAYSNWDRLGDASIGVLSGYRWIWLIAIWAALKIVHELAHGIACRRYGGDVPEAGVLLLLFTPLAYVDVTSSWRFTSRWHRLVVAAAGMYIEVFLAFVALLIWSRQPEGIVSDLCYNIVLMSSVTTVLFNANPLMRFDGYYILSDALGVNNLYSKGTKWFSDWLQSKFFGVPQAAKSFPAGERIAVCTYGILAWCWKILICIGLIIGASVLFQGAGKAIAAIGCVFFFGLPIWTQLQRLYGKNAAVKPATIRVVCSSVVVTILLIGLFTFFRAPATKSAPAIVQFKNETAIRAETEGFVEQMHVVSGQEVIQDQLLIVLANPKLKLDIEKLEQDLVSSRIQARIHKQNSELALFQAQQEHLNGLKKQLSELKNQLADLTIRAPFNGFVYGRGLESKPGSFASQGEELLTIAQANTKEIVVAVDQQDWESLKGRTGSKMRVVMPFRKIFSADISRIDPKASDCPRFAELCVGSGGPLPVKQTVNTDQETSTRLLTPHFYVDLELAAEESVKLFAGQRGRAFFEKTDQSMGNYMMVALESWLRDKIEIATQTAAF